MIEKIKIDSVLLDRMHSEWKWSSYKIAGRLGVCQSTVISRLHEFGISHTKPKVEIDIDQLRRWYLDEMHSIAWIAKEMGVSYTPIYLRLSSLGIKRSKSESGIIKWSNPDVRKKLLKAFTSSRSRKPNGDEIAVDRLIQQNFPGEWEYVGDLSFWVGGKNPDWKHVNGKKKLIEYNGCYYHACQKCGFGDVILPGGVTGARKRVKDAAKLEIFRMNGYRVLVIWGHDSDEEIISKIRLFVENTI